MIDINMQNGTRPMHRRWIWLAMVSLSCLLAACATTDYPELEPSSTSIDQQAVGDGYEYVIGPGDTLDIFVWGYPDLSVSLPVRPDGRITTRLVEDMQAAGKTPTSLARDIEGQYESYVKKPIVTITVSEFIGTTSQQVRVVGGGLEPRTVPYAKNMTLLDLMITIGGIGEFSEGNRAVLIRKIDDKDTQFRARIDDLLNKGDISANVTLYPGDILMIPESWF